MKTINDMRSCGCRARVDTRFHKYCGLERRVDRCVTVHMLRPAGRIARSPEVLAQGASVHCHRRAALATAVALPSGPTHAGARPSRSSALAPVTCLLSHRSSGFREAVLANSQPHRAALLCWNHGPVGPHHDIPPLGRFDVGRTFPDAVVARMRGAEPSELGVRLRTRLVQDGSHVVLSPAGRACALHYVEHLCRSRK
jgi:hypothetical protein